MMYRSNSLPTGKPPVFDQPSVYEVWDTIERYESDRADAMPPPPAVEEPSPVPRIDMMEEALA